MTIIAQTLFPYLYFTDLNGNPLVGGKVYTYIPGTLTKKDTYTDESGDATNPNPLTLPDGGQMICYGSGDYLFVVTTATDVQIFSGNTSTPFPASGVSDAMAPVLAAATTATARTLLGVDSAIAAAISAIQLMPGPPGATGATGATGPQGSTGPAGVITPNVQGFSIPGVYSWANPGGTFTFFQSWSPGGAGSSDSSIGGGGGAGSYFNCIFLTAQLPGSVGFQVGQGGVPSGFGDPGVGGNGTPNTFGPYISHFAGSGGSNPGGTPTWGANGYCQTNGALTIIAASDQRFNGNVLSTDGYGSLYFSSFGVPTPGQSSFNPWYPATWAGSGGLVGENGNSPGGGGGSGLTHGGDGQIIITTI